MSLTLKLDSTIMFVGSCVSRDVGRITDLKESISIGSYVARQSLISSFSPPTSLPDFPSKLESKFQQRMIDTDIQSDLPNILINNHKNIKVLLVDIMDERFDVKHSGAGWYTASDEFKKSGWSDYIPNLSILKFSTADHFLHWKNSFILFINLLEELDLLENTFFITNKFATKTIQGDEIIQPSGLPSPSKRNQQFAPYYDFIENNKLRTLNPPAEVTLSDKNHLWGVAGFHYADPFYHWISNQLKLEM